MIKNKLVRGAPSRRKLSAHAVSQMAKPTKDSKFTLKDCGVLVKNVTLWRQLQRLAPYAAPVKASLSAHISP
ncbi:hypothetical protein DSO57_1015636 [Entomophthora muscae]|uniref:Uncharacterized protein n=1 Tax=Entomophthora muscae TaxID=34485 RepID=A0ACC2U2X4_9FUNG|nr:hypothetical protein DSO57_1015636 [Entomophthora muscae]